MKKTLLLILATVFSLSMSADAVYTSNVTWTAESNAEVSDVAIINETEYTLLKLGTSSKTGSATTTLPAGTTSFSFYCVAWNNKGNAPYTVTIGDGEAQSYTANANSGLNNNTPFTLAVDELSDDDYHTITFDALTEETTLTIATTSTSLPRIGVFGANYAPYTEDEGNDDEGSDLELTGSGTVDNPYTVTDALAIINAGSYTSENVYTQGYVTSITEISTSYGNATYYIADSKEETESAQLLEVYRGYSLNNAKFTSEDELSVGDEVVVYGTLTLYGTTAEITTGSYIYSINGETAVEEGEEEVDMNDPYTSNAVWTAIESAETNDVAVINETNYSLLKLGTSSKVGSAYCTLPAGTTSFVFYCVAWNNKGDAPYTVTLDGIGKKSYTANANSGMNNNSPFTIDVDELIDGDYYKITFDALTEDTKLTIETTSTSLARVGVFGAKYYDTAIDGADTLDSLSDEEGEGEDEGEGEETTIGGLDTFENGGFEEWTDDTTPVGWVSTTTASSSGKVTKSEDAHGGNYSAKISHSSSSNYRLGSKEFILPAGTYSVSYYAKSVDEDGLAQIITGYAPWDTENNKMGDYVYTKDESNSLVYSYPSATEWENITWEFTLEEETQLNLVIMCNKNGGGDVLIDDYTITCTTTTEGISSVGAATATTSSAKYNLSGQKVTDSYRGIVIVDGKKYIKK